MKKKRVMTSYDLKQWPARRKVVCKQMAKYYFFTVRKLQITHVPGLQGCPQDNLSAKPIIFHLIMGLSSIEKLEIKKISQSILDMIKNLVINLNQGQLSM